MAKRITLPLGMVIGQVSAIGGSTLISGRTYDFTNIKMSEIKNVIGAANYNLKGLCLFSGINKWAAFKPYREGVAGRLHHGIIIVAKDFTYEKPTDTEGYKMGHFAGYNHAAPAPYLAAYGWGTGLELHEGKLIWETAGILYIDLPLYLPEFDIRIATNIDRVWVHKTIGGVAAGEDSYLLTDTVITNRGFATAPKVEFETVVDANWTHADGRVVKGAIYLGDVTEEDVANFPTAAGGVVEQAVTIYWRYYYAEYSVNAKHWNGTTEVDTTVWGRFKKDRKGAQADVEQTYWTDSGKGTLLAGYYRVPDTDTQYYEFANGIRGVAVDF